MEGRLQYDLSDLVRRMRWLFTDPAGSATADVEVFLDNGEGGSAAAPGGSGQPTVFRAHRCILEAASQSFRVLLGMQVAPELRKPSSSLGGNSLSLAAGGSSGDDDGKPALAQLFVTNVTPEAFRALLQFAYTGEVRLSPGIALGTLHAAERYGMPALRRVCERFLPHCINDDNACAALATAVEYVEAPCCRGGRSTLAQCAASRCRAALGCSCRGRTRSSTGQRGWRWGYALPRMAT
jgi:hypothetical protein